MVILDEDKILQDLLSTILIVAMEDGKITDDELAILKQVKLDVKTLRIKIEEINDIPLSAKKELELLNDFKKDILNNAYAISQSDRKITMEERNLINSLIKVLMN
ncbi:MAG: hypothetical protein INQ03_07350 [Candidatus Heimdallarchaeota archaeon]|nr:hypothetical protein [Candidatus Heimdallarchaeota archaeon]